MAEIVPLDSTWDQTIVNLPGAHLLQTAEWAKVKEGVGWKAIPLVWHAENGRLAAAALVLKRTVRLLRFGPQVSVCYVPRGPMLDWGDDGLRHRVIHDLQVFARQQHTLFLKMDPEISLGTGVPGAEDAREDALGMQILEELKTNEWCFSTSQVQFRNTVLLDLKGNEDDWLKRMKQKTRYNLRLAQRSGVVIREAAISEYPQVYKMYAETSVRDGFVIRPQTYYLEVWQRFLQAGMVSPLVAEVEGSFVAGLVLFYFGKRAWYLYGMSTAQHREKMPNYLLQWEAMRLAKLKGAELYDLWGAPDVFEASDSMSGVFRFKEGLGGRVLRTCGAWDYIVDPAGYSLYQQVLPRVLNFLRRNRKAETRQEVLD